MTTRMWGLNFRGVWPWVRTVLLALLGLTVVLPGGLLVGSSLRLHPDQTSLSAYVWIGIVLNLTIGVVMSLLGKRECFYAFSLPALLLIAITVMRGLHFEKTEPSPLPVPAASPAPNPADGTVLLQIAGVSASEIRSSQGQPMLEQVDGREIADFKRTEANIVAIAAGKRELVFSQAFGREVAKATTDCVLPRDTLLVVRSQQKGMVVDFWLEEAASGNPVSRRFVGQIGSVLAPRLKIRAARGVDRSANASMQRAIRS